MCNNLAFRSVGLKRFCCYIALIARIYEKKNKVQLKIIFNLIDLKIFYDFVEHRIFFKSAALNNRY